MYNLIQVSSDIAQEVFYLCNSKEQNNYKNGKTNNKKRI